MENKKEMTAYNTSGGTEERQSQQKFVDNIIANKRTPCIYNL